MQRDLQLERIKLQKEFEHIRVGAIKNHKFELQNSPFYDEDYLYELNLINKELAGHHRLSSCRNIFFNHGNMEFSKTPDK